MAGGSPLRVLVADTDPRTWAGLRSHCPPDGPQLLHATTSQQAWALAQGRPDLIVLGAACLQGGEADAVWHPLRAHGPCAERPILCVLPEPNPQLDAQALALGATDVLAHPCSGALLWRRVSALLQQRQTEQRLSALALTDPLTGVANRRCFDWRLANEWARARRSGSTLSLVLLDIDHFKRLNDRAGHAAGDRCLRTLGAALASGLRRPADLLARIGGDEWAALLPDTPLEGALCVAHRLQAAAHPVSLSLGCAAAQPATAGTPEGLRLAADRWLYRAKAQGRGRVEPAEPAQGLSGWRGHPSAPGGGE
jgi:diguanylate cyclase (GGDEF)-like protein